jgi:hypothetical protein
MVRVIIKETQTNKTNLHILSILSQRMPARIENGSVIKGVIKSILESLELT